MKHNIKVDNIILNNESLTLINENISNLTIRGKCQLSLFNCNIININIEIEDNASLILNYFNQIDKLDSIINIKANNKSSIIFNHSFINKDNYKLLIKTDFLKEEANIKVNIHGLNDKGEAYINVDGYVKENKSNNVLDENIRIINLHNGKVISNPNMFINTSKVIANHNTTIGNVNKDELLYLQSKGLDITSAIHLICLGFLTSIIDNEELIIKIKEIQGGDRFA